MKKNLIRCLFLLSLLVSANPAQATMMNVLQASGTVEWSAYGDLASCEIFAGEYNFVPLVWPMRPAQFNTIVPATTGFQTDWIAMLDRSFTPYRAGSEIDYSNEFNAMYFADALWGQLMWLGKDAGMGVSFYHPTIPDFSNYDVHGLYIYNGVDVAGNTMTYDFHVFADVTPVPEPSTVLLLAAGLAGMFGLKIMRKKTE